MSHHEVVIERLALGGNGVGKINGKVCFVPFSAPGDRLKVKIIKEHRSWCEAQLIDILEPSPDRCMPHCPAFGQCGGCDWQHIAYERQCHTKRQLLAETLQRVGKLTDPLVCSTIASCKPYGYRARAQFKLHLTQGGLVAGFYKRGSRFVIDLPNGCPIVTDAINAAMARIKTVLTSFADNRRIPQVSFEQGDSGVVAIIHYIGADEEGLVGFLKPASEQLGLSGLFLQGARKDSMRLVFGSGHLTYQIPDCTSDRHCTLGYEIGGFSQVNRGQNQAMIRLVHRYLRPETDNQLLDLYCGNGNLSLPLAGCVKSVTGVEGFPLSVASAVDNARQLRVNNSTFLCNDVADWVQEKIDHSTRYDLILLDPPRAGAVDCVKKLTTFNARRIVYVSCDPGTLARDLAILCGGAGYSLIEATPLDMFPQTGHLETVALLEK